MLRNPQILIAEDDPDDRLLLLKALEERKCAKSVDFVENGQDALEYLRKTEKENLPHIILLDLNMPKKCGKQTLMEIKANDSLCSIPVIICSTSTTQRDISECYRLGASSYIPKPSSYQELHNLMDTIYKYWFLTARLDSAKAPLIRA